MIVTIYKFLAKYQLDCSCDGLSIVGPDQDAPCGVLVRNVGTVTLYGVSMLWKVNSTAVRKDFRNIRLPSGFVTILEVSY